VLHYIPLHSFVKKLKEMHRERPERWRKFPSRTIRRSRDTLYASRGTVVDAEHTLFTVTARCYAARTPSALRAGRIFVAVGIRMADMGRWQPAADESLHSRPQNTTVLASPTKSAMPEVRHRKTKVGQSIARLDSFPLRSCLVSP
jgi:hypothetical protein